MEHRRFGAPVGARIAWEAVALADGSFVRIARIVTLGVSLSAVAPSTAEVRAVPFQPGDIYLVDSKEKLRGYIETVDFRDPKGQRKRFDYLGERNARYHERLLPLANRADKLPDRTYRILDRVHSKRDFGKEKGESYPFRDAVKRLVIHRGEGEAKPYSPDGPLKVEEIHILINLVFVPSLNGLLPEGSLQVGAKWKADRRCLAQLAGLQKFEGGGLDCEVVKLDFEQPDNGRKLVQIRFEGVIRGLAEEGHVSDDVGGGLYLDAETGKIHSLVVRGERTIFDEKDKPTGKLELDYQLAVRLRPGKEEFSDEKVRDIPAEPTVAAAAVLYEFPIAAAQLVHQRAWALENVNGAQLEFRHKDRSHQLVVNFHDDDKTPTVEEYAKEVAENLEKPDKDKRKFRNVEWLQRPTENRKGERGAADYRRLGVFELAAEKDGRWQMRYWVLQIGRRGATLGCFVNSRLPGAEALLDDSRDVLKSIEFKLPNFPKEKPKAK
jgi:hypothetical protein